MHYNYKDYVRKRRDTHDVDDFGQNVYFKMTCLEVKHDKIYLSNSPESAIDTCLMFTNIKL